MGKDLMKGSVAAVIKGSATEIGEAEMEQLAYREYFESTPCYLTVQDRDLNIIAANRRFRKQFGEVEGRRCYQIYKHRSEKCEQCPVVRTFRDGEAPPLGGAGPRRQGAGALGYRLHHAHPATTGGSEGGDGDVGGHHRDQAPAGAAAGEPGALPADLRRGPLLHLDPGQGPAHHRGQPAVQGELRHLPGPPLLPDLQAPR